MSRQLTVYCIIFALIISVCTFFTAHNENDEQVYLTLAKRITCSRPGCILFDFKQYNLLGSTVLHSLTDSEYHNNVFFHPPASLMAFSIMYRLGGEMGVRAAPILVYLLIAFTIYKILILLEVSKQTVEMGVLLSICSSSLLFNAQKIWLDLFMSCMLIISFYFLLFFIKRKKLTAILLSGFFFFLAVFTKYWAFTSFFPFVLLLIITLRKRSFAPLFLFSLPLLFLVINHLFNIIPISSHPLFDKFLHPSQPVPSVYPFIVYVTHRPFFYYFYSLFLINPAYIYIGIITRDAYKQIKNERLFFRSLFVFLLCFILYSLMLFSIFTFLGGGFQTRYIVFIEPFIILFACLLIERSKNGQLPFLFVFLVHNMILVMMNTVFFNSAELFPFIEMLKMSL